MKRTRHSCQNLSFDRFSKNTQISNFVKVHPVGNELFHAGGRADRQTGMTKLVVTFRNFANAPKNPIRSYFWIPVHYI